MPLAVTTRYDFIDAKGKTSFTKIRVPTGFSIGQYIEFILAMCQLIITNIGARITGASITFSISLAGLSLKTVAGALSDIAQKGYFAFTTTTNGFFKRLRIPTFDEANINADSDTISEVDVNVAAFIAAMENGIVVTGGTVQPTDERLHDIQSLSDAREVFRRKR